MNVSFRNISHRLAFAFFCLFGIILVAYMIFLVVKLAIVILPQFG